MVTAGLPYANGEIHLGGVASTYLPADIYTRFRRLRGDTVVFVCGTDDHGSPIMIRAEEEEVSPEELVRHWHDRDTEDLTAAGIVFDLFHNTHSEENKRLTQEFFSKLHERGYIYEKTVEQWYCEKCAKFLPDRYVVGTCPYCGATDQYSDSCEVCGRAIEPGGIQDPHCSICGSPPIKKKSSHYFFKLSEFSDTLKEWLEGNENLQKEVKGYVLTWIREGLRDWDITRDISWGVPIPLKGAGGKVLYVWFDNHLGYISFVLKCLSDRGIDGGQFWNSSEIFHFIGKDIVYHHYLFLPAMRLGEGRFKLPDFIPTRGHLMLQGKKFSKSRGWYISLEDFVKAFPADYLRYYLTSVTPYSQKDANFDLEEFKRKVNGELTANVGNFIHRVLTFIWTQFDGKVPEPNRMAEEDQEFERELKDVARRAGQELEAIELANALRAVVDFSTTCNRYFQGKKPWEGKEGAKTCLYLCANAVRSLAIVLEPFIPFSTEELWGILDLGGSVHEQMWESAAELAISPGHAIKEPKVLFRKIGDEEVKELKEGLGGSLGAPDSTSG